MNDRSWHGLFDQALAEFNALSGQHQLGVTMVPFEQPPSQQGLDGADVMVSAASGEISTPYGDMGQPVTFDAHRLHGLTLNVLRRSDRQIIKAFVYMPADPAIPGPRPRSAGPGVRLVILVHELVHACGLSNAEHCYRFGLFQPMPNPLAGDTPAGDRVDSGRYGSDNLPVGMPPIILDDVTIQHIQNVWSQLSPSQPSQQQSGPLGRGPVGMSPQFAALHRSSNSSAPVTRQNRRRPGSFA